MSTHFFKYPHTPHLAWLAAKPARDDKVLSEEERSAFLDAETVVEEKVDGANIGFSVGHDGTLQVQNRGNFIGSGSHPQFSPLWAWMAARRDGLIESLGSNLVLFGEWCVTVHSVPYDRLPDWFLGFDVFDREANAFYSVERRNRLLARLDLAAVPLIGAGRFSVQELVGLLDRPSAVGAEHLEGLYLRREEHGWLSVRAKLVRPEFIQQIETHWSAGALVKNRLAHPGGEVHRPGSVEFAERVGPGREPMGLGEVPGYIAE